MYARASNVFYTFAVQQCTDADQASRRCRAHQGVGVVCSPQERCKDGSLCFMVCKDDLPALGVLDEVIQAGTQVGSQEVLVPGVGAI